MIHGPLLWWLLEAIGLTNLNHLLAKYVIVSYYSCCDIWEMENNTHTCCCEGFLPPPEDENMVAEQRC